MVSPPAPSQFSSVGTQTANVKCAGWIPPGLATPWWLHFPVHVALQDAQYSRLFEVRQEGLHSKHCAARDCMLPVAPGQQSVSIGSLPGTQYHGISSITAGVLTVKAVKDLRSHIARHILLGDIPPWACGWCGSTSSGCQVSVSKATGTEMPVTNPEEGNLAAAHVS